MTQYSSSAENQVAFLQHIQRLFEEGEFTATYKFALLIALTELSVENWNGTHTNLSLTLRQIAEKFAEFYWPQTAEYSSGLPDSPSGILIQNLGSQASVVNILQGLRSHAASIGEAKRLPEWPGAISAIAGVVRSQPVKYLQNIASTSVPFLYDYPPPNSILVLKADAVANLARYQGLIYQLAKAGWIDHVRTNKRNEPILGKVDDLESFMFGSSRKTLVRVGEVLIGMGENRCFYCEKPLRASFEVDHFIPWSKYPRDLAHNFVLADPTCNRSKSDMLAANGHLKNWISRNRLHGNRIQTEMSNAGILADHGCIVSVARWAYGQGVEMQASAWLSHKNFEKLDQSYLRLFA